MSPSTGVPDLRRQVGDFFVVPDARCGAFVDQAKIAGVDVIGCMLERDRSFPAALVPEGPTKLRGPEEDHSRRPPVIHHIRKYVPVHEQRVGLSGQEWPPARISVPNAYRSLTSINAGAV